MILSFSSHYLQAFCARYTGISIFALVIVVFVLFYCGTVGRWVSLFSTLIALLILPILFIGGFLSPPLLLYLPLPNFPLLAYPCSNYDPECRSFGQNYFAAFVQEINSLWTGSGVQVVPCGEFILKVRLQLAVLCTTMSQYSVGKLLFFSVYTDV